MPSAPPRCPRRRPSSNIDNLSSKSNRSASYVPVDAHCHHHPNLDGKIAATVTGNQKQQQYQFTLSKSSDGSSYVVRNKNKTGRNNTITTTKKKKTTPKTKENKSKNNHNGSDSNNDVAPRSPVRKKSAGKKKKNNRSDELFPRLPKRQISLDKDGDDCDINKTTVPTTYDRKSRESDLRKIEELQKQLELIESEKQSELRTIQNETKQRKNEYYKSKAERKKMGGASPSSDDLLQGKQRLHQDNVNVIATLRDENAKIRDRNTEMRRNVDNLRSNNEKLSQTIDRASGNYYEKLKCHHDRLQDENDKLTSKENDLKKRVQEAREEVDEVTALTRIDHVAIAAYKRSIQVVCELVTASSSTSSDDDRDLVDEIRSIVERFRPEEEEALLHHSRSFRVSDRVLETSLSPKKKNNTALLVDTGTIKRRLEEDDSDSSIDD